MTEYVPISSAAFPDVNLRLWLIGALIATISYGIVLTLVLAYVHDFIMSASQIHATDDHDKGQRRRIFFLAYTTFMFAASTLSLVAGSLATINLLFASTNGVKKSENTFSRFGEASSMAFASWGSDALMIWRCIMLYQTASKVKRSLLIILLTILSVISFGAGLAYVITSITLLNDFMIAFAIAAAVLNTTLTALIICRIRYHQIYIKGTLGSGYTAIYSRLIHLFIESAALVVVFNVAHVALFRWPSYVMVVSHHLLVHVYVISALLILYRATSNRQKKTSEPETIVLDTELQFSHSNPSTSTLQDVESCGLDKSKKRIEDDRMVQ